MTKCKVLLNNEAVTVFEYNNTPIQIPSIHKDVTTINVVFKNGYYTIVDDDYVENTETKSAEKVTKKTTTDKNIKRTKNEDENV